MVPVPQSLPTSIAGIEKLGAATVSRAAVTERLPVDTNSWFHTSCANGVQLPMSDAGSVAERANRRIALLAGKRQAGEAAGLGEAVNIDVLRRHANDRAVGKPAIDKVVAAFDRDREISAAGVAGVVLSSDADRNDAVDLVAAGASSRWWNLAR
jgi:hypothetical protein